MRVYFSTKEEEYMNAPIFIHKYDDLCESTSQCFKSLGMNLHLYSKSCTNIGILRRKKTEIGQRHNSCQDILKSTTHKSIKNILHRRGENYDQAEINTYSLVLNKSMSSSLKGLEK